MKKIGIFERYRMSKLNKIKWLPIIYLSLGTILFSLLLGFVGMPKTWRIGLIFGLLNFLISFGIGKIIVKNGLSKWWSFIFPVIFAGFIFLRYANYNYFFSGLYLIITWLGMSQQDKKIYR